MHYIETAAQQEDMKNVTEAFTLAIKAFAESGGNFTAKKTIVEEKKVEEKPKEEVKVTVDPRAGLCRIIGKGKEFDDCPEQAKFTCELCKTPICMTHSDLSGNEEKQFNIC